MLWLQYNLFVSPGVFWKYFTLSNGKDFKIRRINTYKVSTDWILPSNSDMERVDDLPLKIKW